MKQINPNLIKLAEQSYNPDLKIDSSILEEKVEKKPQPLKVQANINKSDYIQIPNTNILISKQEILKGNNWESTHFKLAENGLFMPSPALFMPYFLSVKEAAEGKLTLYNGLGNAISRNEVTDLYKYLTTDFKEGCWSWLDAKFVKGSGNLGLDIETDHRVANVLVSRKEPLEACLEKDCFVDLGFNSQGIPIKESRKQKYEQGKNIRYWYPRENRVARFYADSGRANLSCGGDPDGSSASLGVFACAEGTLKKQK